MKLISISIVPYICYMLYMQVAIKKPTKNSKKIFFCHSKNISKVKDPFYNLSLELIRKYRLKKLFGTTKYLQISLFTQSIKDNKKLTSLHSPRPTVLMPATRYLYAVPGSRLILGKFDSSGRSSTVKSSVSDNRK